LRPLKYGALGNRLSRHGLATALAWRNLEKNLRKVFFFTKSLYDEQDEVDAMSVSLPLSSEIISNWTSKYIQVALTICGFAIRDFDYSHWKLLESNLLNLYLVFAVLIITVVKYWRGRRAPNKCHILFEWSLTRGKVLLVVEPTK
jgi:hypothetical protein